MHNRDVDPASEGRRIGQRISQRHHREQHRRVPRRHRRLKFSPVPYRLAPQRIGPRPASAIRTPRIATPANTVLGDRCRSTRYGSISLGVVDRADLDFPAEQTVDQGHRRRHLRVTPSRMRAQRRWAPNGIRSNGQSATSPASASETRKTSGRVPFATCACYSSPRR